MKRLLPLWFVAILVLWTPGVRAANVAILRPVDAAPEVTEALFRLQGELLALGLAVEIADRPAQRASGAGLEQMASERRIDALIDVVGDGTRIAADIWIFERSPRRSEVTHVALEPDTENAAETLAIRAIEVLRSNFLEIDLAARRAEPGAPPPHREPSLPAPPPDRARSFGLEVGAGVLTGLDGVGPALLPVARLNWAALPWLVAQATVAGAGTRPAVETETGRARVAQQYGVLGLRLGLAADRGLHPFASLAAGTLRTSIEGEADSPWQEHSVQRWSFLLEGSVGARMALPDRFHLALASHVHVAEPYVRIHFAESVVATSGRPNLLVTLALGAWL